MSEGHWTEILDSMSEGHWTEILDSMNEGHWTEILDSMSEEEICILVHTIIDRVEEHLAF